VLVALIYVVAVLAVVVIALVTVGRETFIASRTARPAVFDLEEAVSFVADGLDDEVAGHLTPDDVKWILRADADRLEAATRDADDLTLGTEVLEERSARDDVLARLSGPRRELISDDDVTAVLAGRTRYLEAIGAIGPRASEPDAPSA
jgi:hypothetical protein